MISLYQIRSVVNFVAIQRDNYLLDCFIASTTYVHAYWDSFGYDTIRVLFAFITSFVDSWV